MHIGIIGTGAIAYKHAQAWQNIGCSISACANRSEASGRKFADTYNARFLPNPAALCADPAVDLVDVCAMPNYRLEPVRLCLAANKPLQLQKPMAINLADARLIVEASQQIPISVVSQHRFDDASIFLHSALQSGRLGKLLQADCYVKWYRSPAYYARPGKGAWDVEGGGALINQAIHQVDLLRWLIGPVALVHARWSLGALHHIESEDVLNALLQYENGALGVIQASTAFWPGYPERIEIHGAKGSAIITGDRLTAWDVSDDSGDPPPLAQSSASGAADPMAISLQPFERQFQGFLDAIHQNHQPPITAQDGYNALDIVERIYQSARLNTQTRAD